MFLSHSSKDKAVVRASSPSASNGERVGVRCRIPIWLRQDGVKVWCDEWVLKPPVPLAHRMGEGSWVRAVKIGEGLERSRVLVLCTSANAFASDWAQLEAGTFGRDNLPFRDPLKKGRRFLPLRLDDAP